MTSDKAIHTRCWTSNYC